MKIPHDLPNKVSYTLQKRRFYFVEYTSVSETSNNEVLLTACAIVYVVKGSKEICVDGKRQTIAAGQLFMLPKGKYVMSEYLPADGEFKSLMLFFSHHHISDIYPKVGVELAAKHRAPCSNTIQVMDASQRIANIFRSLDEIEWEDSKGFGKELLDIKIRELIYTLLANAATRGSTLHFLRSIYVSTQPKLSSVVGQHLYHKVSIEGLAIKCNMSLSTFKREFTKEFNASPMEWITNKRLEKSLLLIQNTTIPITEIAYDCGFENYVHFARRFKARYGEPANRFRAMGK